MSTKFIQRASSVVLNEVRKALPGQRVVIVTVEDEGPNVSYFRQALDSAQVQQELAQRGVKVELQIINPIQQVKEHVLRYLRQAGPQVSVVVLPCLSKNADVYYKALALPEVKAEFENRGIKLEVRIVDGGPSIAITTYDDVASGRLDEYFK